MHEMVTTLAKLSSGLAGVACSVNPGRFGISEVMPMSIEQMSNGMGGRPGTVTVRADGSISVALPRTKRASAKLDDVDIELFAGVVTRNEAREHAGVGICGVGVDDV